MTDSNTNRLTRIESKLTRMMLSLGLDMDGNPSGLMPMDRPTADMLVAVLSDTLAYLDADPDCDIDERLYLQLETAYNRCLDMRRLRWKTS